MQHGASTLPDTAFNNFPKRETAEIHLATNFQNMLFDHMPAELARDDLRLAVGETRKTSASRPTRTSSSYYKTRKKALGPFKEQLWNLPDDTKAALAKAYDEKFAFLFEQLGDRRYRADRRQVREAGGDSSP